MLKSALFVFAAVVTCAAWQSPAHAGDRIALSEAESWNLALYETEDEDGGMPGGGLAFTLDLEGVPTASLALDYSDGGERAGDAEGLGLLAAVDLIGGEDEEGAYLRLSYRAGDSAAGFGGAGGLEQGVAIRTGIRW